jgi:hypothetical protein
MPKPFERWTVLPHGKLTEIDDGVLTVVGDLHMPIGEFPRRMTVVRLDDGRLVVYSAIALDDDEMQALQRMGTPAVLVVPSEIHRLDARAWKRRYPAMMVVAPPNARAKVEEVVPVDATELDLGDPRVRIVAVQGTDARELALTVERAGGTTLVVNDVIWNVAPRRGLRGWIMKVTGMTGPVPRIPTFVARRKIDDRDAFRAQLERWAATPGLRRIVVSHGDVVTHDPANVLRRLSAKLLAA